MFGNRELTERERTVVLSVRRLTALYDTVKRRTGYFVNMANEIEERYFRGEDREWDRTHFRVALSRMRKFQKTYCASVEGSIIHSILEDTFGGEDIPERVEEIVAAITGCDWDVEDAIKRVVRLFDLEYDGRNPLHEDSSWV